MTERRKRAEAPSLSFDPPDCSICGESTELAENQFTCPKCGSLWNQDGSFNAWADPEVDQCETTVKPWENRSYVAADSPLREHVYRCILAKGHELVAGEEEHACPEVSATWVRGWR